MLSHRRRLTSCVLIAISIIALPFAQPRATAETAWYDASAAVNGTNFTTTFTSSEPFGDNKLFDIELWDNTNHRVFQHFETQDGNGRSSIAITQPVTTGLPDGLFTVKAGVFSSDWSQRLLWDDNAGVITVSGGKLGALDASATVSGSTFDTLFTNANGFNGQYLFDVELWDANNNRVYQYFNTLNVSNSTGMTITKVLPSSIGNGTYTAKAGVFTPNWTNRLLWNDTAGTVTVGSAAPTSTTYAASGRVVDNGANIEATFTSSRPSSGNYLFDVELWDSSNKRVFQAFDTTYVNNATSTIFTRPMPTNLSAGNYTIKTGWFTPYWSSKLVWNDNAGIAQLGSTAPSTPIATTTSTSSAPATTTTTTPAPVFVPAPAAPVSSTPLTFSADSNVNNGVFTTRFTTSKPISGRYMYDMELYDASNKRVFQYFEVQASNGNSTISVDAPIPSNVAPGTYRAAAGVFSEDWTVRYLWDNITGSVTAAPATPINNNNGPAGQSGAWNIAFRDEFNDSALDTTKWTTCSRQLIWWKNNCMGHNTELQSYTPDNVSLANFGNGARGLRLTAKRDGAWNFSHDQVPAGSPRWTSGMVSTSPDTMNFNQPGYKPFQFTYGFYEVRLKTPNGKGFWPAAWAFPADNVGPQELDLLEVLGDDTRNSYMTVHYDGGGQSSLRSTVVDTADGFHTYGMDWQPDHIGWYIDGRLARTTFTNASLVPNKSMYLMLNFAVGGDWPGMPDGSTPQSATFDVDWVRVWKKN